jgi:hypothetical protein
MKPKRESGGELLLILVALALLIVLRSAILEPMSEQALKPLRYREQFSSLSASSSAALAFVQSPVC